MMMSIELDRRKILNTLNQNPALLIESVRSNFKTQLEFLGIAASKYYNSQQSMPLVLIRPFLIGLIEGEQALKDFFGADLYKLVQALHDIAFLRQLMVLIKSSTTVMSSEEQCTLIKSSQMTMFREKLKQQEHWKALLKVMEINT